MRDIENAILFIIKEDVSRSFEGTREYTARIDKAL
jgi:hypothetical protein